LSNSGPGTQGVFESLMRAIEERLGSVRYKVMVISGKGGVGKSFITTSLALATAAMGRSVGILDADIHGPSIPKILGISKPLMYVDEQGIHPAVGPLNIRVISTQLFLPEEDTPVIWRGPLKGRLLGEFLSRVVWGSLDYMYVDLPPGTGDEALSVAQYIKDTSGAVIITIPSDLSRVVVKKAARFCKELKIPILGVIENMSSFTCPKCGTTYELFGSGAGARIANEVGIPYLGSIPLDPRVSECNDNGEPFIIKYPDTQAAKAIKEITEKIIKALEAR